ncbi:MAG: phage tail protein [Sphingomonadales bacterium]|nr:phage tail protein [Sphingomonadales bacterium]MDE2568766.1 phage tail protein [Sphingomonadales bacterium]
MATLILTAVGTALGGPLGGAIGALIGQQVDTAIIGSPTREGPRLKDLSVQTSSYGAALPLHFGTMRAAGTVIWATDLVEHRETQGGGKGRPSVTAYTYTSSFAVALSSRPISGIGRIWADGNLLRGAAGDLKAGGTLRIHTGYGDQPVDPLIAQAEGGALCPAFRHCAYVVFEDLELADFGNRLPSLTFEILADAGGCSLAQIVVSALPEADTAGLDAKLDGFSIDSGRAGDILASLSAAFALTSSVRGNRLAVAAQTVPATVLALVDQPVAGGARADAVRATGWSRRREPQPAVRQVGLRYYDPARDYQPGLQWSPGRAAPGDLAVTDLPAAMAAAEARGLAGTIAHRNTRPADRIRYRVTAIDLAIMPGQVVRLPVAGGAWLIESWEWQADGVLLDLLALSGGGAVSAATADPGRALLPVDTPVPATDLAAFELPWDGTGSADSTAIFAAASAANSGWRGAALFARQPGGLLAVLGSTGRRRAVMGRAVAALQAGSPHLVDRYNRVVIELAGPGLQLAPSEMSGLLQGGNRALLGEELIQFASVELLADGRYSLSQLLRGRGGTEWAIGAHVAGERFVLLDDCIIALDSLMLGDPAVCRVLAAGLGDVAPVESTVNAAGSSRRPLSPVHGSISRTADGGLDLAWVRRARGAWGWPDFADIPLNEAAEVWDVSYGDPAAPVAQWRLGTAALSLAPSTAASLAASAAPARFSIRQVGSVSASPPLSLDVSP